MWPKYQNFIFLCPESVIYEKKKNKILPEIETVDTMGAEAELSTS